MVDWGKLSAIPCYFAAVHNMKPVAKCMAMMLANLRTAGLNVEHMTCVGHSLGAHLCGMMANYLPFRMHRIIGTYVPECLRFFNRIVFYKIYKLRKPNTLTNIFQIGANPRWKTLNIEYVHCW